MAQIEILASLQTVDREIKEQRDRKQELLTELAAKEKEAGGARDRASHRLFQCSHHGFAS